MPRLDRINEEIRHIMPDLLSTVKDPRIRGMVSVTRVDATADLKQAKIYISVLNDEDTPIVLKGLKSASGYLRRELGHSLQLRNTPELFFIADDSIKRGAHILDILNSIDISEEDEDNNDNNDR